MFVPVSVRFLFRMILAARSCLENACGVYFIAAIHFLGATFTLLSRSGMIAEGEARLTGTIEAPTRSSSVCLLVDDCRVLQRR